MTFIGGGQLEMYGKRPAPYSGWIPGGAILGAGGGIPNELTFPPDGGKYCGGPWAWKNIPAVSGLLRCALLVPGCIAVLATCCWGGAKNAGAAPEANSALPKTETECPRAPRPWLFRCAGLYGATPPLAPKNGRHKIDQEQG